MSSTAAGLVLRISGTSATASSSEGKASTASALVFGLGTRLSCASRVIARVPSLPTRSCARLTRLKVLGAEDSN